MNLDSIEAYKLVKKEKLNDIRSTGYLLRHIKTGARIMVIENDDENKVFNIAFRTPPKNSTGVAHILEHSVLCGSRDFPLKDPFVELVKGSLNTFLNAMTYPDKTCYPVASCNDQDFQNLMHVYLDAVFYPNIYKKEEIFRQEGWSYHLEKPEGPLTYNGVVYNEMKGAFSSPDDVLERDIMNSLFPDITYGCESGGDPDNIPDLSYEEFLDFHRTYYHPSNSYIYLYGNMDMAEKLKFIDEKYLSAFDSLHVDSEIREQKPFDKMRDLVMEYPVAESESEENNSYLAYSVVTGTAMDSLMCTAFEVLDYALLSTPGAPLKKALLDAGIGSDVYGSYEDGIRQPYFDVVAKGASADKKAEFLAIIRKVLTETVQNGIDPKALEAGINCMEFRYREADFASYPKGLIYGLDILDNWLYDDEHPFAQVQLIPVYERLKELKNQGYFEELIRKYLLDNPHGSILTLNPSRGLTARKAKALEDKLATHLASLSEEEKAMLVKRTQDLEQYQSAPEDPEAAKCIPMLKREDIRKKITPFTNEALDVDGSLFLYHEVPTNGIGYLDLMFDLKELSAEKVPYLGLLKSVLGYVDTAHYTYGELTNEINAETGGIMCGVEVFDRADSVDEYHAFFSVRGKVMYPKTDVLFKMIREILNTSSLKDTKRLHEIISQVKSRAQSSLVSAGHSTAVLRAASYSSPMAAFQDSLAGIAYYQFIEKIDKEFEKCKETLVHELTQLMREILRPEYLCISYTAERESLEDVQKQVKALKQSLHQETTEIHQQMSVCQKKNEGFTTSGQVQYVAQTGNFRKKGYEYTGALNILKVILSYDYLWTNIRVKGGAYGCMSGFKYSGESFFVSYRDPHLKRTLEVYKGIPEYVRSFHADEREMTKYIIGTISGKDVPRTPKMQGAISRSAWFCGVTEEMAQKERDEILQAKESDIQALAPLIEAVLSNDALCVVGSEPAIQKEKELFDTVLPLING
ncbi:insulinase family protein [Blautia sp. MSJ-19]|uniref:insulinase family protein n=1 Tax=Blautia sp. MSJ-19 TaxID=2841517 RepID=UPI001C0ED724|nr:insulinase family protein [Blautia sp. MSJ-19]MBU5481870.1 insulinase family protein [Blautia sp. MSJ-19]